MGKRRKITQVIAAILAFGMLSGSKIACGADTPLPPVEAPLVATSPGECFAPMDYRTAPLPKAPLPPRSTGTHVTALLRRANGVTLVAVWGDPVLWEKKGEGYQPAPNVPKLPESATEIVALREEKGSNRLIVGTRRAGEFVVRGGTWEPLPRDNAPIDANAQAITAYRGALFVATLNDGLVVRDAEAVWQHVAPPTISSDAPRQFVVWHDNLYVRHGNGMVDVFDGRSWTRDIFTKPLPRRQVSAMAVQGGTLYLAQWGGWSETTDGTTFMNRFPEDLRNLPITALLPQAESLFVGTQGRGLAEFEKATGILRQWHDERQGIGDDWITTLTPTPTGGVVAGTFVAGAYLREKNQPWQPVTATSTDCVTASVVTTKSVFLTLRKRGTVEAKQNDSRSISGRPEAQAIYCDSTNNLLWIGTRTGIHTISWKEKP